MGEGRRVEEREGGGGCTFSNFARCSLACLSGFLQRSAMYSLESTLQNTSESCELCNEQHMISI